ncbi:MAG: glutamyl-tRNA reductase [Desulfobacteraceae bacterium]|nr:glutamyl-tRNA reductase [Desulfobacteraceae bacterium]
MDRILLIGLNHKTAPVEIRECFAFTEEDCRQALTRLCGQPAIEEALLTSTCNRVELLLCVKDIQQAVVAAKGFFSQSKQIPLADFEAALYQHHGDAAVRHLFRVAASLDSMVLGEPQILGQVKTAYRLATEQKSSGVILNRLLHNTFSVAKRIRTETGIGDSAVSISYAAIELARKIFGTLEGKEVLLIGAGEMAELAVEHLIRNRAGQVFVANRTFERGVALAARFNGTAIRMEEIAAHLDRVDIIISSTGAPGYVVQPVDVKGVMRHRRNRPLFFIDIAVPRDIDPKINDINNAYVYDIDDLNEVVDENIEDRRREAVKAERIIDEAVIKFRQWFEALDVVPTIKALHAKIRSQAQLEVQKTLGQLAHLTADDQKAIERMTEAMVNKILHHPTQYIKNSSCQGDRAVPLDLVRKIFGLDE